MKIINITTFVSLSVSSLCLCTIEPRSAFPYSYSPLGMEEAIDIDDAVLPIDMNNEHEVPDIDDVVLPNEKIDEFDSALIDMNNEHEVPEEKLKIIKKHVDAIFSQKRLHLQGMAFVLLGGVIGGIMGASIKAISCLTM